MNRPDAGADVAGADRAVPALAARDVSRRFGRVLALRDVTAELRAGEVHAIVGENGAGKSTLTNILGGIIQPDAGTVEFHGRARRFTSPAEALDAGIGIVFQEQSLVPEMSVADNVLLGVQPRRGLLIQRRRMSEEVRRQLERVGAGDIPVDARVRDLSVARGQLVEIAKVLAREPSVVIFDEPTAVLPADDAERLLALIRRLSGEGVAIGYISHRLKEVEAIADQVTVLRDGELVWTRPMASVTLDQIVSAMVGRSVSDAFPERETTAEPTPMLDVRGVRLPGTEPEGLAFTCSKGEILGIAGLVGSGRSRVARYLMGLEGDHGGEVLLDGQPYTPHSPRHAIRAGIMLVPEDRKGLGLVLPQGVDRNVALPSLERLGRWGFVDAAQERRLAEQVVRDLDVRVGDVRTAVQHLSGGNQQKVVLGKWLARGPRLLILDEPLRGIDVNAKAEIHRILRDLAGEGLSIILISSELPEVLGLSDRVLVMRDGRIASVFEQRPFNPDDIMAVAAMDVAA